MTHADDAAPTAAPVSRSQKLARTVLLAACTAGLVGLSLPGSPANTSTLAAAGTPVSADLTTELLHAPTFVTAPVPRRAPARASRSRALTVTKTVKKTASAKRAVLADSWVRPSSAPVVSPYGMRWGRMHKGIDFGAHYGAPIYAIGDGDVVGAGYLPEESGYGQITLIRHSNGFVSAYAHQSTMVVHAGDHVHAGELIGYVGSTGHVTGPHLHFEIRTQTHGGQVNPSTWLRDHGVDV